ncbi:MAG: T9SS type A sorting domain-containing protein [Bacteroidia bacterium]|nr:T9SS type A sorting domain-containing protein [Bacteroidia bacterium]
MKHLRLLIGLAFSFFLSQTLLAQELNWAYSFTHPDNVREGATGFSTNGKDRFVISGRGIKGVNLDVKGQKAGFDSDHSFISVYDLSAKLIWTIDAADPADFKHYVWNAYMNKSGEVFSLGRYSGKLDFDPGTGKKEVQASPLGSMYIQKFDASGSFQWVLALPFPGIPYHVTEQTNGNLLIAGKNSGDTSVTVDGKGTIKMVNGFFLVEVDGTGKLVNAGSGKANFNSNINDITVDQNGNIILVGTLDEVVDFDLGPNEALDTSHRSIDAFVASYKADFSLNWQKRFGDIQGNVPSWDGANGVGVTSQNEIIVAGSFRYTADFDPDDNPGKVVLTADQSAPSPDGFVLKYSSNGSLQWVKQLGGEASKAGFNKDVEVRHLALDDKHIYLTGSLVGIGDFDPSNDTVNIHSEDGSIALFVGQYDLNGNYESVFLVDDTAAKLADNSVEEAVGIEVVNGALYAYGTFQKDVDFDPGEQEFILSTDPDGWQHGGDKDLFVARWDFDPGQASVGEPSGNNDIVLFPNPGNGLIHIKAEQRFFQVCVVDQTGKKLLDIRSQDVKTIDLRDVAPGLYTVQLVTQTETVYKNVLVTR